jgi:hypothetical protein
MSKNSTTLWHARNTRIERASSTQQVIIHSPLKKKLVGGFSMYISSLFQRHLYSHETQSSGYASYTIPPPQLKIGSKKIPEPVPTVPAITPNPLSLELTSVQQQQNQLMLLLVGALTNQNQERTAARHAPAVTSAPAPIETTDFLEEADEAFFPRIPDFLQQLDLKSDDTTAPDKYSRWAEPLLEAGFDRISVLEDETTVKALDLVTICQGLRFGTAAEILTKARRECKRIRMEVKAMVKGPKRYE